MDVIGACVRADDPLAFGIDQLRHARAILAAPGRTEAAIPGDHRPSADETVAATSDQALLDAALDGTRPARVEALAGRPPPYLLDRLGPPPASAAGRAVWCHLATGIEAVLDRNGEAGPLRSASDYRTSRRHIILADRYLSQAASTADPAA